MANISQKRHEIPTRILISYDFEHYFPTLQKARIVFTQPAARERQTEKRGGDGFCTDWQAGIQHLKID